MDDKTQHLDDSEPVELPPGTAAVLGTPGVLKPPHMPSDDNEADDDWAGDDPGEVIVEPATAADVETDADDPDGDDEVAEDIDHDEVAADYDEQDREDEDAEDLEGDDPAIEEDDGADDEVAGPIAGDDDDEVAGPVADDGDTEDELELEDDADEDTEEPHEPPATIVLGGNTLAESPDYIDADDEAPADAATLDLLRATRADTDDLVPIEPLIAEGPVERRSLVSTPLFQITMLVIGALSCLALWQWKTAPPATSTPETATVTDEVESDTAAGLDTDAIGSSGDDVQTDTQPEADVPPLLQPDSSLMAAVNEKGELWTVGAGDDELLRVDFSGRVDPESLSVTRYGVLFASDDGRLWIYNRSTGEPPVLIASSGDVGIKGQAVINGDSGVAFVDNDGRAWSFDPSRSTPLESLDEGEGGAEKLVATAEGLALLNNRRVTLLRPNGNRPDIYKVVGRDDGFPVDIEAGPFGLAVLDDEGRVWLRTNNSTEGFILAFDSGIAGTRAVDIAAGPSGLAVASDSGRVFWHDAATADTSAIFSVDAAGADTTVDVGVFGVVGKDNLGNGWLFNIEAIEEAILLFQASTRPEAEAVVVAEFGVGMFDETGDVWLVQSTDGRLSDHSLETLNILKVYDAGEHGEVVGLVGG